MEVLKLNFRKYSGTAKGSGHRSSNGWVTCWTDFIEYKLTVDNVDHKLSIVECDQIKLFSAKYKDSYESDQDWGVYIEDECYEENIDITQLIKALNGLETKREYIAVDEPQQYSIDILINQSLNTINQTRQILDDIAIQEFEAINKLKLYYSELRLQQIYPNLKELIRLEQINLNETFLWTKKYPIDIIIANYDYVFLLKLIAEGKSCLRFSDVNALYSAIVTSSPRFYEQLINHSIEGFTNEENNIIYNFVTDIEENNGKHTQEEVENGAIRDILPLKKGMLSLAAYILLQGKFTEWEYISKSRKIYSNWNFMCWELVALQRVANLAFERWNYFNFENKSYFGGDYSEISHILYGGCAIFRQLLPFMEMILKNDRLLLKLSSMYGYYSNGMLPYEYLVSKLQEQVDKMRHIKNDIGAWC